MAVGGAAVIHRIWDKSGVDKIIFLWNPVEYMKHKKIRSESIIQIGHGTFGTIYSGITGQAAVEFLLLNGSGEVKNAFYHPDIGGIDIVFGAAGLAGYGLAHIAEKHQEIIFRLQEYVEQSKVLQRLPDRTILLYEPSIKSIISLTWHDSDKNWLVTTYEKIPD